MGSFLTFVIIFILYFLPALNAYSKKKRNAGAILLINTFFGWTLIGWFIALLWSATNDARIEQVVVQKSGAEELEKLAALKEKGVITEEEFQNQKSILLDQDE